MARAVHPNTKCNGCYHYNAAVETIGGCMVDLRPEICGEGAEPDCSYSPFTLATVDLDTLHIAENVEMFKSVYAAELARVQRNCTMHSGVLRKGTTNLYGPMGLDICACHVDKAVLTEVFKKSVSTRMQQLCTPELIDILISKV